MTESTAIPTTPNDEIMGLRESQVRQAMGFLRDPRVRSAPLLQAVNFLRSKRMTDFEVREAFKRLGIPFPDAAIPQVYFAPEPRRGSSWSGAILTVTLAAGALYALREVLRRYVVPAYFPELVEAATEAGNLQRRSATIIKHQERQIVEMRETIEELRDSARETSEKVERLSLTVSTTGNMEEQRQLETAQLRDAIRQLSQTVSASTGAAGATGTNSLQEGLVGQRGEAGRLDMVSGSRRVRDVARSYGALATVEESHARTPESDRDVYSTPMLTAPNTEQRPRPPTTVAPTGAASAAGTVGATAADADDDDFMKVAPAEVEKHWGASLGSNTVASDRVSTNSISSNVPTSTNSTVINNSGISSALSVARIAIDEQEARKNELLSATRKLFQEALEPPANASRSELFNGGHDDDRSRNSVRSAPNLEVPLSDSDY